jgi:hypothetical protein
MSVHDQRDLTQANAILAARALLTAALKCGIHVGAALDGSEVTFVAPMKVPREVRHFFEVWLLDNFRQEVIEIIRQDAGRRS